VTDVRAPEADPFESSPAEQDQGRPDRPDRPADRAGRAFGLVGWLKWAWRQLTSMRIALVLLWAG
jgi:cytochrome c biogenesis protein